MLRSRPREDDGRRFTVCRLAERLRIGRCHLVQVLNGTRLGGETWPKLAEFLSAEELAALGRNADGTKLHVERFDGEKQTTKST